MRKRGSSTPADRPPEHLRRIDMGRYVEVMARHVEAGDTFGAGMVAWRAWRDERSAWAREHGLSYWEQRDLLGPAHGPDFGWLMRTYGLDAPSMGCPPSGGGGRG